MLDAKNLGIAFGLVWGFGVFISTYMSMLFGWGGLWIALLADVYPWYDVSILGSFIGLFWGFLDGFIGLFIFGLIYNKLSVMRS